MRRYAATWKCSELEARKLVRIVEIPGNNFIAEHKFAIWMTQRVLKLQALQTCHLIVQVCFISKQPVVK